MKNKINTEENVLVRSVLARVSEGARGSFMID